MKTARTRLMGPAALAIAFLAWNAADAWSQTAMYYSVGTDTLALYSNSASATAGTLTLSVAAINKIGVGDEIRRGANRYYITSRISPTQFTIQNSAANGGTPGDTNITFASTPITIFRAFNALSAAVSGSSDANHLNTVNLTSGGGFQLNWTCYNDSFMNDQVFIDGWTTSATRYIRVYTPTAPTEVGVSQRHRGLAGTGFRLLTVADAGGGIYTIMRIQDDFVRIEGIEIDGTNVDNDRTIVGIRVDSTLTSASQPHLDSLLIHDLANVNDPTDGDTFGILVQDGSVRISNTIIYDLDQNNVQGNSEVAAISFEPGTNTGTSFIHNVTIYDVKDSAGPDWAHGLERESGTVTARNVVVLDVVSTLGTEACFFGTITQSNNVSSDATATGATNKTAYASYFVSVTPGSENLHLQTSSNVLWGLFGADLDTDPNLPVTDDIDEEGRHASEPDIGADEASTTYYRSIGTRANDTGTVNATQGSRLVNGVATAWVTNNRGRGDRIDIGGTNYTVLSVQSNTQLTLTEPFQAITGPYAFTIARKFANLQAWEDCISNTTVVLPQCHDVFSANLILDNRSEVGVAYDDGASFTGGLLIDGSVTDPGHTITLTADGNNRHYGIAGNGVVIDNATATPGIRFYENYGTVEWMEIKNGSGGAAWGIEVNNVDPNGANRAIIRNNLIHDIPASWGIQMLDQDHVADVYNNIVYTTNIGIRFSNDFQPWTQIRVLNNTLYNNSTYGINVSANVNGNRLTLQNNLAALNGTDYAVNVATNASSSYNLSTDPSASNINVSPGGNSLDMQNIDTQVLFVNRVAFNLHIQSGSTAANNGLDLTGIMAGDVDGGARVAPWDIGADDILATTAVDLVSFSASGFDGAVKLTWATGSEIDNLGFHLYRSAQEEGPYTRITASVIPGLGSSPQGARYDYVDTGLTNGATYYYKLEDVETTGKTELHGPISAAPIAGRNESGVEEPSPGEPGEPGEDASPSRITFGNPLANELRVTSLGSRGMELELISEGFYAYPEEDGTVRLEVPGLELMAGPGEPAIPVYRGWVEALAGRRARLGPVQVEQLESFTGLRPASALALDVIASSNGTARAGRRRVGRVPRDAKLYPAEAGALLSVGFQGEIKKAQVELAPLRWDEGGGRLWLAKRVRVQLLFGRRDRSETVRGGKRHSHVETHETRKGVWTRLATVVPGVYGVRFEDVFGNGAGKNVNELRLSRQGEAVAFHVLPDANVFQRGSVLYFLSEGANANPYGRKAVYELEASRKGVVMEKVKGSPQGPPVTRYWKTVRREENLLYQAALLEADDVWLWDWILGPLTKSFSFRVENLAESEAPSHLDLWLQGASDFPADPDHHIRVYVNGTVVAEEWWNGKQARRLSAELGAGVLREGENELAIENVGDTGASHSMVMLDRFEVRYLSRLAADHGVLRGSFTESGAVRLPLDRAIVLDVTGNHPRWLTGVNPAEGVEFGVESNHQYLAVSEGAIRSPELRAVSATGLRSESNAAEYLVIGPRQFLSAAEPLLRYRRGEGLRTKAVAAEDVYSEFGHGEETPESVREFLSYAYHHWSEPSVRYVLLLGDGTYDTKDYLATGVRSQVPVKLVKTQFVWTASDPWFASVNGEDILPDVAIGRLPAASLEEVQSLVQKILEYETGEGNGNAPMVLVTDNPDVAGDFDRNADDLASTTLSGHEVEKIYLSQLGTEATRSAISSAFNDGASLVSYIGHGGIHVWANENLLEAAQVSSLSAQSRQPLLLTMNCLNGYFHFPYYDSLSEALLKAEDKGAIAAFSPSGLSLDTPAHRFHKLLMNEIVNREHARLGDAVLAGQAAYADTSAMPELLSIYHLLGDPALTLK